VRVSVFAASVLCAALLAGLSAGFLAEPVQAQVPAASAAATPLPALGFLPPYEIARTVRRAGFDPLAPPLREGSTYVVRATDFRGILMRVVVDARSGAIRDATRIVAGPGSYGPQIGMVPYEPLPNEMQVPYGQPADYDAPPVPLDDGEIMTPRGPVAHPLTRASVTVLPPLPRPRPPELAARKPADDTKPNAVKADAAKPEVTGSASAATPVASPAAAPTASSAASPAAAPPASPAAQAASPSSAPTAAMKPGKALAAPPIND
jgi:hypothetical protein